VVRQRGPGRGPAVPANLTLAHPPPHGPELDLVERVWPHLRVHRLGNRVLAGGRRPVLDAARAAWNALLLAEPGRLRAPIGYPWLPASVTASQGWYQAGLGEGDAAPPGW
jgi:hypothetical protein